ncbi:ABC transporter permease subunit [Rhizobium leguminosarum]|uniref:ABC transporter permease subunit n=1 Tax=Rhizobium leguminosarum TaxID=384 RepID=UPI001C973548|nr:ABC transporter permease subunit [Rhizobium leguminosarum]MBY5827755.1 ABC transporter permease subunit [Rhizobium leguminosarum]
MEFNSIPRQFYIQFIIGLLNTTSVFFLSAVLGTLVGITIAVMNVSQEGRGSNIAVAYTNTVRGVPELLIILIAYFGGTAALSALAGQYVEINAFAAGVIALTLVFGGYAAEIFRGAINAVPVGQVEAAKSLGLAPWQSWIFVIIPQMVPPALPSYGNLCISLIKDTALISVVGLTDVMRVAYVGAGSMREPLPFYLAASAIYLCLTTIALVFFRIIEQHFAIPHGGR